MKKLKIVAISDIHCKWNKLKIPECDILISAGDYSFKGEEWAVKEYHEWLRNQNARHIISVQGNHELWVEKNFILAREIAEKACPGVYFIDEDIIEIEGVKIFCSAVTPWFHNWAWNKGPKELETHWNRIPEDVDIIVTHGPPYGIGDEVVKINGDSYDPKMSVGCPSLLKRIQEVKPDLHICGHIHCGHGQRHIDGISYYNVSICDELYMPSNPVTEIDYEIS